MHKPNPVVYQFVLLIGHILFTKKSLISNSAKPFLIGTEGSDVHEGWEEIAFNEDVEPSDGLESLYGM